MVLNKMIRKILIVAVLFVAIIGCNCENEKKINQNIVEVSLADSVYKIPIELVSKQGILKIKADYEAKYNTIPMRTLYQHKMIDSNTVMIKYHLHFSIEKQNELTNAILIPYKNVMIYYKLNQESLPVKACYIKWVNKARKLKDGKTVVPFTDITIDEYTDSLETNISPSIIKKLFPKVKCEIKNSSYSKIVLDYQREIKSLDFFAGIKFVD